MEKPTGHRLSTDGSFDIDLTERVARQLQDSFLHVLEVHAFSALPDELRTGAPIDDDTSILVPLTLVTDGRRGFLVLSSEDESFDVETEFTKLLDWINPGSAARGDFVLRGVTMFPRDRAARSRSLRLTDPTAVRAVIEAAYEAAFSTAGPVAHEVFLDGFRAYRFSVKDEAAIRDFFVDHSSAPGGMRGMAGMGSMPGFTRTANDEEPPTRPARPARIARNLAAHN